LFKLDKEGSQFWKKIFANRFGLICETTDRSLILSGISRIMKTDSLGNEIWLNEDLDIDPNALQVTSDQGYILGGDKLLKFDEEGTEEWRLELDGTIYSLQQTDDEDYVFCGEVSYLNYGWLTITDRHGYYQSIVLYFPQDGERVPFNDDYLIEWRSRNIEQIKIEFSDDNGMEWEELVASYPADSSAFLWDVPFIISNECKIRLTAIDLSELYSENEKPFTITYSDYDYIAVNQIKMWFSNNGDGSHDPNTDGNGLYWPGGINATKGAVFEDGLIFSGVINGEYYAGGNTHRQGLQPGKVLEDGSAADPDSTVFGIWKIRRDWGVFPPGPEKDRLEQDYHNWPVDLGAPWIDHNGDGLYDPEIDQPKLYGDETNWMVMNDLDSTRTQSFAGRDPMGLEFQSMVYGYDRQDALADVVFKRYKIINKGQNFIEDMTFGYWSDVDLGDAGDDFMGSDTLLDLAYCYNASNNDELYGSPPPAVGYVLLQGPIIDSEPGDSAWYDNGWIWGYKNLRMTSFSGYI
jgi:hypothetical protein